MTQRRMHNIAVLHVTTIAYVIAGRVLWAPIPHLHVRGPW